MNNIIDFKNEVLKSIEVAKEQGYTLIYYSGFGNDSNKTCDAITAILIKHNIKRDKSPITLIISLFPHLLDECKVWKFIDGYDDIIVSKNDELLEWNEMGQFVLKFVKAQEQVK